MAERRGIYWLLVGKREGKRPLGRPRQRMEDIKMHLKDVGWIDLAWDMDMCWAIVNAVRNLRGP
jgi:hypothetical protein